MRVLLVKPLNTISYLNYHPDLGLGYLATALKRAGHVVEILDLQLESYYRRLTEQSAIARLAAAEVDVIGFKAYHIDLPFYRLASAALKELRPRMPQIVGGPSPSGLGTRIFERLPLVDFAFQGEAEIGLPMLLERLEGREELAEVPGLIWRDGEEVRINPPAFVEDLDSLAPPDWELMRPDRTPMDYTGERILPLMVSRGCPYPCAYCQMGNFSRGRFRHRSIDSVMDELRFLNRRWGFNRFSLWDDNITVDRRLGWEFAEKLLGLGVPFRWRITNGLRVETLDVELMRALERSGCFYVYLGIESGSQRVLDLMNRKSNLERLTELVIRIGEGTGIKMLGYFILGYPGETVEEAGMSIDLACRLPLDRASFFNFTPLPGTAVWDQLYAAGKLDDYDFETNTYLGAPTNFAHSSEMMKRLKRRGYSRFYARPRIIRSMISDIESFGQLGRYAARIYSVIAEH